MANSTAPDLSAWLPHAGPARLVTRAIEVTADAIRCEGLVPPESPYVRGESCPTWVGVELGAQAAALLEVHAYQGRAVGPRPTGYLVRVRDLQCTRPAFPRGTPLEVRVERLSAAFPLFVYTISVRAEDGELLRGQISTYLAVEEPFQTSLKQNH